MQQHSGTQLVTKKPLPRAAVRMCGKGRDKGNFHGQISEDDFTDGLGGSDDCFGSSSPSARHRSRRGRYGRRSRCGFGLRGEGQGKSVQGEVLPRRRAVDGHPDPTTAMQNQSRLAGRRDRCNNSQMKARPAVRETGCGPCHLRLLCGVARAGGCCLAASRRGEGAGPCGCRRAVLIFGCRIDFAENRFHFLARCSKSASNASAAP